MLNNAAEFLRTHDDFLLIAHISPDGDTLGSCLALYASLLQLKKNVQITCEDSVPQIYRFLPNSDRVLPLDAVCQSECVVSVDCADLARTGKAERVRANFVHGFRKLETTLENESASADTIKEQLTALRAARVKAQQELAAAQQDLRQILTVRQEAVLVLNGLLN